MSGRISEFLSRIYSGPQPKISILSLPPEQCDREIAPTGEDFRAGTHYFTIRVTSVGLAAGRKWFSSYLPLITTACEFTYDDRSTTLPFVVGPSLIAPAGQPLPTGTALVDTRVCGIHPYVGGEVSITVVLSRVVADNSLSRLLAMIEKAGAAFDVAGALAPYLAIANVVAGGLSDLFDQGDAMPLLGARLSVNQDNASFRPGYLLAAAADLDPQHVWLRGGEVLLGSSATAARPLITDYVLLVVEQATERSDARSLPAVREPWSRVQDLARSPDEGSWLTAKSWLSVLAQDLYLSPDLTRMQAERLYQWFIDEAIRIRDDAVRLAQLGPEPLPDRRLQVLRNLDDAIRAL